MCYVNVHSKTKGPTRSFHKAPSFGLPLLLPLNSLKQAARGLYTSGFGSVLNVVLHFAVFQKFPSVKGKYCG